MRLVLLSGDEGTFLSGAVRVTEGQIPFRDFFEVPGPGSFYWLALFFKVLGTSFLSARISLTLTTLCTALLMYFLARRLGTKYSAVAPVFFLATSFGPLWPAISQHHDSDLSGLLAFVAFLHWIQTRAPMVLLFAGSLAGITTCFMQPKGACVFIAFVALVFIVRGRTRLLPALSWLTTGYASVLLAVIVLYWRAGALPDLVYANVVWPVTRYSAVNRVPYGHETLTFYGGSWFSALAPVISPAIAFLLVCFLMIPFVLVVALPLMPAAAALRFRGRAFNGTTLPYWVVGIAWWVSEIHRQDITHLVSGSPVLMILFFHLLGQERQRFSIQCAQLICAATFGLAIFNLFIALSAHKVNTSRGAVYVFGRDPVLKFLSANVKSGNDLFAYPYCPIYYFLSGARNPTRYSILMYGINSDSQFRDAVKSLQEEKVRYVIYDRDFNEKGALVGWPAYVVPRKEHQIMERYLDKHYGLLKSLDRYDILERRPGP